MTDTDIRNEHPYLDPLIERLALEAGLAGWLEADSKGRWLMSDYGSTNRGIAEFAARVAEECARIIEAQDVDPAFKGRMAWAVRDRFKA